jgi:acyl-CoA synthetase (AMP-forming)/AMP-acid ligase II/acyl carrier protein
MALEDFLHERITDEDTFRYTIPDILRIRANFTPDQNAFIYLRDGENEEEKITYRELDHSASSLARHLIDMKMQGERALMLYPPGLDFVKALFGCFYAGVIAVPAYPPRKNRSLERIRTLVVDSGAKLILSTEEIRQTSERSFSDVKELQQLTWLTASNPSSPYHLITLPPDHLTTLPQPGDIALLQYTSGSTGQPKGVMVTHRNIMRNVEYIRQSFSLSQKSVSVTWLPSFHDMGLIDGVIEPVYTGFPGVIIAPVNFLQKPVRWLKAISKYRGTHGGGPNFAFDLCVDGISEEEKQGLDLSSMKTLYCGAEPIRKSTFERFVKTFENHGFTSGQIYPCYGMAETTLIISGPLAGRGPMYIGISGDELEQHKIKPMDDKSPDCKYLVGVGYPWIDTTVRIVNPETTELCAENEVGEIWVSGSIVTIGYWNKQQENERIYSAIIKDIPGEKYLRTGDLGFFYQDELFISGRLKDMIIIHGRNYYPQDIELIAEHSHPALRANASAAFPVDVETEEKLVILAEVERTAMRGLNVDDVCDAIRQQVGEEFELEVFGIVLLRTASILKTSSGKIQRKACKEAFLNKTLEVVGESILDQSENEEISRSESVDLVTLHAWVIAWIHAKLKIPIERINMDRPITAYGLTSMKAVQLQQDFLTKYGVNFPPYLFFERIALKDLAERAYKLIQESEN